MDKTLRDVVNTAPPMAKRPPRGPRPRVVFGKRPGTKARRLGLHHGKRWKGPIVLRTLSNAERKYLPPGLVGQLERPNGRTLFLVSTIEGFRKDAEDRAAKKAAKAKKRKEREGLSRQERAKMKKRQRDYRVWMHPLLLGGLGLFSMFLWGRGR